MADPLSITASILSVADVGLRVATKLYTYANAALRAPVVVRSLAQEVSLTAAILSELGTLLKTDEAARLASPTAMETAKQAVIGCQVIFDEIGNEFEKAGMGLGIRKWVWPMLEEKVKVMLGGLERGKSTILLLLNVITFAKQVSEEKPSREKVEEQRILILELQKKNEEAKAQYELIRQTLVTVAFTPDPNQPNPPKPSHTDSTLVNTTSLNESPNSKDPDGEECPLCGVSTSGQQHMSSEELAASQKKIEALLDKIATSKRHLGGIHVSTGSSCEDAQRQIADLIAALELLILWQAMAMQDRLGPVEAQSSETPSEYLENFDFEGLVRQESWFERRKNWISDLLHSKTRAQRASQATNERPGDKKPIKNTGNVVKPAEQTQSSESGSGLADRPKMSELSSDNAGIYPGVKESEVLQTQPTSVTYSMPMYDRKSHSEFEEPGESIADTARVDELLRNWTTLDAKTITQR